MVTFQNDIQVFNNVIIEGGFFAGTAADANLDLYVKGPMKSDSINNATTDTDKFLVSDGGVIKYRTGAEVLSDIGAGTGTVTGTGANLSLIHI